MKNKYFLENEIIRIKFLIEKLGEFLENVPNDNVNYEELQKEFLQNGYFGSMEVGNIIYYWGYTKLNILKKDLTKLKNKLNKLNLSLSKCY